ncbi:MAG TPA: chemotaxis protein CheW [Coleofasciculaceae cyanobacterium]
MVNLVHSASSSPGSEGTPLDPSPETRQRLLRFSLDHQDSALLPLAQIAEILRLAIAEIVPIPDLPHWVLGIYNWRGEMLWLIDFNALVGYPSIAQQQQRTTSVFGMVVQDQQQALGFIVPQVQDIELHDLQELQPAVANLFSPDFLPFVLGVLPKTSDPVLDVRAIAQSHLWQKDQIGSADRKNTSEAF